MTPPIALLARGGIILAVSKPDSPVFDNGRLKGRADAAPATRVDLQGPGPFLMPNMVSEITFGIGDTVLLMQLRTESGQEVLMTFSREAAEVLGTALVEALDRTFPNTIMEPGDITFEKPENE